MVERQGNAASRGGDAEVQSGECSPRGLIKYTQGLDKDNDASGMRAVECRAIFGAKMEVEGERYGPSGTIWPSLLVGADGMISLGHRW